MINPIQPVYRPIPYDKRMWEIKKRAENEQRATSRQHHVPLRYDEACYKREI